ncbi:hypothetical protein NJ7G_0988 [Natrinema sp. J7-2]|nr:hypothetical protein NJ7G_0988 [Natrinema sp. J7-2]
MTASGPRLRASAADDGTAISRGRWGIDRNRTDRERAGERIQKLSVATIRHR